MFHSLLRVHPLLAMPFVSTIWNAEPVSQNQRAQWVGDAASLSSWNPARRPGGPWLEARGHCLGPKREFQILKEPQDAPRGGLGPHPHPTSSSQPSPHELPDSFPLEPRVTVREKTCVSPLLSVLYFQTLSSRIRDAGKQTSCT